jgi:hypothetical protein
VEAEVEGEEFGITKERVTQIVYSTTAKRKRIARKVITLHQCVK